MIICVLTVAGPTKLLPHFIKHYSGLGVDLFVYNIYGQGDEDRLFEVGGEIEDLCLEYGSICQAGFFEAVKPMNWRDRALRVGRMIRDRNYRRFWTLYPDLDEFLHLPPGETLTTTLDGLADGTNMLLGYWRDRFTETGELAEIPSVDKPLNEVFPWVADVSTTLVGTPDRVVVACKDVIPWAHHPEAQWMSKNYKRFPKLFPVDHYKWNADLLPHLRARYEHYSTINMPNTHQSKTVLDHLEYHGKVMFRDSKYSPRQPNNDADLRSYPF